MSAEPLVVARELEAVLPSGFGVGPVTLEIHPGEQVLVLGPSGSGKSTLLRMLHGAVPHAVHARVSGAVAVAGRDVASIGIADLADVVGVVGQDPSAGVCLADVDDELALGPESLCVDPRTIPDLVADALASCDAAHLAGRATAELSGGELQRIALAAATVMRPRLLLLDEPTSMLDGAGIDGVRRAVDQVRHATGAAVVLVEHRLDEYAGDAGTAGLPGRWLVLDRSGRITFDGPPDALSDDDVRALLEAGCWLPHDLEWRVGAGDVAPVQAGPRPGAGPLLRARALAVAPGGAGRTRRRRRGPEPVLAGIDLDLYPGEVVALVGANGTGKSSLLTCLAGLHPPAAGTVEGARAGLVFQNPEDQFQAQTVAAEVAHEAPDRDRARRLLDRFDLADLAGSNPYQLSGGQKRRLSLAAMLAQGHPVLLADEPGFGLDRTASRAVEQALRDVADEGGAVLYSSHDLRSVVATADRVLVVGEGTLLADTTPVALVRDRALLARAGLRTPAWLLDELAAPGHEVAA